jgi:hypothetical protein
MTLRGSDRYDTVVKMILKIDYVYVYFYRFRFPNHSMYSTVQVLPTESTHGPSPKTQDYVENH